VFDDDDNDDDDQVEEEDEEEKKNVLWPATFVPWCCSDEIGSRFIHIVEKGLQNSDYHIVKAVVIQGFDMCYVLDLKLSPCFECRMLSSGFFFFFFCWWGRREPAYRTSAFAAVCTFNPV
jgi:hypothetical protein